MRLFEKTLFYFEDFNFSADTNQYFLTDGVKVLAHINNIDYFDSFVNGFFYVEAFDTSKKSVEIS